VSEFSDLVTRDKPRTLGKANGGKSGALLATYEGGVKAIVKVAKDKLPSGHRKQRGIPAEVHPAHEVAFCRAAQLLGYGDLVPETVLTAKAVPGVVASAQLFVPARHLGDVCPKLKKDLDAPGWGALLAEACLVVPKLFWKRLLAVDIIGGARDRHANNVGLRMRVVEDQPVHRIVAWDNAVSFGKTFDRYHNVFHKHIFRSSVDFEDVWPVLDKLTRADLRYSLDEYLSLDLLEHAFLRARFFVDYPYRLPWKVCSKGIDDSSAFPDYRAYFEPVVDAPLHMARVSV
jgi:hypothetical protein